MLPTSVRDHSSSAISVNASPAARAGVEPGGRRGRTAAVQDLGRWWARPPVPDRPPVRHASRSGRPSGPRTLGLVAVRHADQRDRSRPTGRSPRRSREAARPRRSRRSRCHRRAGATGPRRGIRSRSGSAARFRPGRWPGRRPRSAAVGSATRSGWLPRSPSHADRLSVTGQANAERARGDGGQLESVKRPDPCNQVTIGSKCSAAETSKTIRSRWIARFGASINLGHHLAEPERSRPVGRSARRTRARPPRPGARRAARPARQGPPPDRRPARAGSGRPTPARGTIRTRRCRRSHASRSQALPASSQGSPSGLCQRLAGHLGHGRSASSLGWNQRAAAVDPPVSRTRGRVGSVDHHPVEGAHAVPVDRVALRARATPASRWLATPSRASRRPRCPVSSASFRITAAPGCSP